MSVTDSIPEIRDGNWSLLLHPYHKIQKHNFQSYYWYFHTRVSANQIRRGKPLSRKTIEQRAFDDMVQWFANRNNVTINNPKTKRFIHCMKKGDLNDRKTRRRSV